MKVDWTYRGEYIASRSSRYPKQTNIEVSWANEAVTDKIAFIQNPDPASDSKLSMRIIGYSKTAGFHITVIVVENNGRYYGANAWKSNKADIQKYKNNMEVYNG